MSTDNLPESEYDKVGDFYYSWLEKHGADRDTRITEDIEIMRHAGQYRRQTDL